MSLDPSKRSRFGGSKVRTGCLTCKLRHLKCDEGRPSCTRCLRSGRVCQRSPGTSDLRMVHYGAAAPTYQPLSAPDLDRDEQRYIHMFRTSTAFELAGVHDSEFWLRYTSQMAVVEPAIRYAVVAVADLHRKFGASGNMSLRGGELRFPLTQYSRAIHSLTESMESPSWTSPDTPLVACALFCAFESMCYHLHSALSHVNSGIKVLEERILADAPARPTSIPKTLLNPLYTMLDTQRLKLGERPSPSGFRLARADLKPCRRIDTVDQAQSTFDEILSAIFQEIHAVYGDGREGPMSITQDSRRSFEELMSRYRSWCDGFDILVYQGVPEERFAAVILLQTWRLFININLEVDLKLGEMDFDRFTPMFRAIVELSIEYVYCRSGIDAASVLETDMSFGDDKPDRNDPLVIHTGGKVRPSDIKGGPLGVTIVSTPFVGSPANQEANERTTEAVLNSARTIRQNSELHRQGAAEPGSSMSKIVPTYSIYYGIVWPLYMTICRCRDPTIRRQGLALMQACKRREGLWDSNLAARLGSSVLQIEERRAAELRNAARLGSVPSTERHRIVSSMQIPNEARVRMIRPTFLPDRRSIEQYYFGLPVDLEDPLGANERWIEEHMEW